MFDKNQYDLRSTSENTEGLKRNDRTISAVFLYSKLYSTCQKYSHGPISSSI